MKATLVVEEIRTYSRKQIIAWVESNSAYKFQELKNGLFFLRILKKLVKSEFGKHKIYEVPKNEYQYTHNLNIVKRILNRYGFQFNMNVSEIVKAKNCFQLANWFKNLYDLNKEQNDDQFNYSMKSYTPSKIGSVSYKSPAAKSMSRATSSDVKKGKVKPIMQLSENGEVFVPNRTETNQFGNRLGSHNQFFNRNVSTSYLEKTDINEYSSGQKIHLRKEARSLAAKKRQKLFLNKTSNNIVIDDEDLGDEDIQPMLQKRIVQQKIQEAANMMSNQFEILLKKEAIKENIVSFQNILDKIREYLVQSREKDIKIEDFQKRIRAIIYLKDRRQKN